MIDPFGWNHSASADPWAFFAPPGSGAASIDLWDLPPDDWSAHTAH